MVLGSNVSWGDRLKLSHFPRFLRASVVTVFVIDIDEVLLCFSIINYVLFSSW